MSDDQESYQDHSWKLMAPFSEHRSLTKCVKTVRDYVFDCVVATIGTNFVEDTFSPLFRQDTLGRLYVKEILLNAAVAFGLGWLVYLKWQHRTAFWIWPIAVGAFIVGFALAKSVSHTDPLGIVTLGFVSERTIFYSLGAIWCFWRAQGGSDNIGVARGTPE